MTEEFKQSVMNAIKPMEGWCWEEKAIAMVELILAKRPKLIVEIGVFGGKSLIPQAMACELMGQGVVVGIDPWKKESAVEGSNDPVNNEWWDKLDLDDILKGCSKAIWQHGLDNRCLLMRGGAEACRHVITSPIDILHIDGNHSEEVSTRDVGHWFPKVKQGGHIWFDDFDWPSTQKANRILSAKCDVVRDIVKPGTGSCRLYRKL